MMTSIKAHPIRFILLTVLVLLTLRVLLWGGLNMTGFCWAEKRWLSDEERINLLITRIIQQKTVNLSAYSDQTVSFGVYPVLQYASVEDFRRVNPACCVINPVGPYELGKPRFIDRSTGFNSGKTIRIKYTQRYQDDNGQVKSKNLELLTYQTNCGLPKQ